MPCYMPTIPQSNLYKAAKFITISLLLAVWLAGCSSVSPRTSLSQQRQELVLFSLALLDTDYKFGGKNPEAGIDCSGMVSYVFKNAAQRSLTGSAADIAQKGRLIDYSQIQAGDLVFFNTRGGPFTHVGIYIGDQRFIHAPSSSTGKVRIDEMNSPYFSKRFTSARRYFD